jgi:hypothetical protein
MTSFPVLLSDFHVEEEEEERKKEKILKSFVKQNKKQHFQYEGSCQSKPFLQWFLRQLVGPPFMIREHAASV